MKLIERRSGKERPLKNKIVVIYHANCADGFGGAWAAWKKFGKKADYVAAYHQTVPPADLKGKEVYSVDYVYPKEITQQLIEDNDRVTAIDHHISAKETTKLTKNYSYALHNSGAVLSWKYFHPKKPVPLLLRYVEDGDLWKFKLPKAKEILDYLDLFNFNFKTWSKLARDLENSKTRRKMIERGSIVLQHEKKMIDRLATKNAEKVLFFGHKVYAVNSPNFVSELGNLFYTKLPPIGIIWHKLPGRIVVSLRSNGKVDVSKLAAKFGGGGHRASASFRLAENAKLPWKVLKNG